MGRVLGGGSIINVMVWARGHKNDWEFFASEAGGPAWSYESVPNIYRRMEDWHGEPDPKYRGTGGPERRSSSTMRRTKQAPITPLPRSRSQAARRLQFRGRSARPPTSHVSSTNEKAFNGFDILVNNAGVYAFTPIAELAEVEVRRQFETNVFGLPFTTREAIRHFGEKAAASSTS